MPRQRGKKQKNNNIIILSAMSYQWEIGGQTIASDIIRVNQNESSLKGRDQTELDYKES